MKFVKVSGYENVNDEIFVVLSGATTLYTGSGFINNETRITEQCLTSSLNNQYTIVLFTTSGTSWSSGSYLTIYGKYGNAVFKFLLVDASGRTYPLSLYYGIEQNATWTIVSGSASSGWTDYSFSDSSWINATLGSDPIPAMSGTQYFRKQFVGLSDMAAYDVRLYYKAGVIAYINGNEVYRDNLPDGSVSSTTAATGQYSELAYRGFIRPGSEVASQQSILAVEVHFLNPQSTVDFNAYLAILAHSVNQFNCFMYAESIEVQSDTGSNVDNIIDFDKSSYYYASSSDLPATVTYTFQGPKPFINVIRIWPYTSILSAPSEVYWQGSNDNSEWMDVISIENASYDGEVFNWFTGYYQASLFNHYRVRIASSVNSTYVMAYELHPMICHVSIPPSIAFTPNNYTIWAKYEEVHIQPDLDGFSSCSAENLPEGLTIDPSTCVISGFANVVVSNQTITVTSTMSVRTYTGSFILTVQECAGTMLHILRTYKFNAAYESFEIKDALTQEVVMSIAFNSIQTNNEDWTTNVCVSGSKYEVTLGSTTDSWYLESYLYIYSYLYGNEMETILRMRYDLRSGSAATRTFNTQYTIHPRSNWYYKLGTIPADWHSSTSTEGWNEGNESNFPDSSNQIQLYKRTFSILDMSNSIGFVLSLKFKYGCIVYLNGHEAYRKGLTDATITTSSYSDNNSYSSAIYRQVSLPIKTVQIGNTLAVNYIQQGLNTIAIGIVAADANQKEAIFDCALRLMSDETESRVFDYAVSYSGINGDSSSIFSQYYDSSIYSSTCTENYLNIAFNNDRHEWINSVTLKLYYTQNDQQPHEFVLKARSGNDDWTVLTTVFDLTWSQIGGSRTIYFANSIAYHEYRFEDFATGDNSKCGWKLNTINLNSIDTSMTIPELEYNSIVIPKDYIMDILYPNSEYYYNFQISPALPDGITFDPNIGIISGTPRNEMGTTTYSITANKLTGGTSTATFSITVEVCTESRGLISLVVRTDEFPEQSSYKLYQGIGTSGSVIRSNDHFELSTSLNYVDICLESGVYTLELFDSAGDGWSNPAGYYLTVEKGEMIFEMGQVPSGVASVSTMFSSYLPFQMEYTEWKISYEYERNWNTVSFDDSEWVSKKAAAIGKNERIITYLRKEVDLPDIDNYQVLNILVKYEGGIVAYFNGRVVARFNLNENFDLEALSISQYSGTKFSKFHVILSIVGGVNGKNIIAFEVYCLSSSCSHNVVFDASGVFGVNECSIVLDSYSSIIGTIPSMGTFDTLLDLNPTTYGFQINSVGTYLDWKVDNLEGTRFNAFGMQTVYNRDHYGFSLFAMKVTSSIFDNILVVTNETVKELGRSSWSIPRGTFGFRQIKFQVDIPASDNVYVSSYMLLYCKSNGTDVCPGIDGYASAREGEYSLGECESGYYGNKYRICSNGQLGEIHSEYCKLKPPANLHYENSVYEFILDKEVRIKAPTHSNIIEEFYLGYEMVLPAGLSLNSKNGEITGVPTEMCKKRRITIYGKNQVGYISTTITMTVRKGRCESDGIFEATNVGDVYVYQCPLDDLYVGKITRACVLGEKDGEWGEINGFCMSAYWVPVIVLIIAVLLNSIVAYIKFGTRPKKTRTRHQKVNPRKEKKYLKTKPPNSTKNQNHLSLNRTVRKLEPVRVKPEHRVEPIKKPINVDADRGEERISERSSSLPQVTPVNMEPRREFLVVNTKNKRERVIGKSDSDDEVIPVNVEPRREPIVVNVENEERMFDMSDSDIEVLPLNNESNDVDNEIRVEVVPVHY